MPAFDTAKVLFDRYWDAKRQSITDQITTSPDRWLEVIEALCDEMTTAQQLSVAKEKLDRFSPDYLKRMSSEGVLTFDGRPLRDSATRASSTTALPACSSFDSNLWLPSSRSRSSTCSGAPKSDRCWPISVTPTGIDTCGSLPACSRAKGSARISRSLRLRFSPRSRKPTEDEWAIWKAWTAPALKAIEDGTPNPDKLSTLAWRKFADSATWFRFAGARGVVAGWLNTDNVSLTDVAVSYVIVHGRHSPDRVAALLEPYADHGGQWPIRLLRFMQWPGHHMSRRLFDLFLRLVKNDTLGEARGPIAMSGTFWGMLYGLRKRCPEWIPGTPRLWPPTAPCGHPCRRRNPALQ